MNKALLLEKILAKLAEELETHRQAARTAFEYATDAESKAENKYDTRGLEASYLARGQAQRVAEIEEAARAFGAMNLRAYGGDDPIGPGALVELESGQEKSFYLIGPSAGGMEIEHEGREVLIITAQSPLAKQLLGRGRGDPLSLPIGRARSEYRVVSVS